MFVVVLDCMKSYHCITQPWFYMYVSQVKEERLVVTEGEEAQYLTITMTLPPRVLCTNPADTCTWTISTVFLQPDEEVRCADDRQVAQALIGWTGDNQQSAFCGSQLTDSNWRMGVRVAVRAGLDGLKDGTQQRLLRVSAQWLINSQLSTTVALGDVPVSSLYFLGFVHWYFFEDKLLALCFLHSLFCFVWVFFKENVFCCS